MFTQQICFSTERVKEITYSNWYLATEYRGTTSLAAHVAKSSESKFVAKLTLQNHAKTSVELAKFWPFQETSYPSPKKTNCGYVGYWMILVPLKDEPYAQPQHASNIIIRPSWDPIHPKVSRRNMKDKRPPPPFPCVRASFQRGCQPQDFLPAEITHWYESVSTGKKNWKTRHEFDHMSLKNAEFENLIRKNSPHTMENQLEGHKTSTVFSSHFHPIHW